MTVTLWGGPADGARLNIDVPHGSRLVVPEVGWDHVYRPSPGLDEEGAEVFVYQGAEPNDEVALKPRTTFHLEHSQEHRYGLLVPVLAASWLVLAVVMAAALVAGLLR